MPAPKAQPNRALLLPLLYARSPVILCPCASNVPQNARRMLVPMGVQTRSTPAASLASEISTPSRTVTPAKSVPPLTNAASPASCSAVERV